MSKPMGPIPPSFRADDEMLLIGGRRSDTLIGEAGDTPLFVYDFQMVEHKVERFRVAFPNVQLHYAIKANSYEPLLKNIARLVDGLDVASAGEMEMALRAGAAADRISFAGPGKRDSEMAAAMAEGITINLESEGEAQRAVAIGNSQSIRPRLAVRVNPDFEIKGSAIRMSGGARPFGVDSDRVSDLVRSLIEAKADWRGFHIFAGSQSLSADSLIDAQAATLDLAAALAEKIGVPPPLVNLGGGFGIPYFAGEKPLDVEAVAKALNRKLASRATILAETVFAIELGRWLVGEAGVYLTRIVDRKVSHGKTFLVTDGGLHHQLAASGNFGQVVRRNYPVAVANRFGQMSGEEVSVVGCLCTPLDRLADDVMLPRAEVGDVIAIFLAGAYGLSASPQAFLGHPQARETVVGVS
ncbi:MAG: pyridoxal-dependent decarboxylase, exosortase A system-associated [Sphingosinicella sp.]|nr:pyridoxal-dependent decarboxylase, exosortase A system-associated [Sphingosinicella sp.]